MSKKAVSTATGKLSLTALILMIFTSVYGFNNIPRAFFKMGYGAIPWYIIGGLFFFLPFAFMIAEMGAAYKDEKGGIYSWMEKSVGPTFAFVGTLMWYASFTIWMVNVSSAMLVPLTNMIFGETKLPNLTYMTLFAIVWMTVITFLSTKGLDKIKKFTSIGGTAVLLLNALLLVGAIIVLISNGFELATPLTVQSLVESPNPSFEPSLVAFVAFMVYAIFAYGGVETVGGLVDETENPEKTFPKGVIFAAVVITVGYSIAILSVGFFINFATDWAPAIADGKLHLGNVGYVMMATLGDAVGSAFGLSSDASAMIGSAFARFMGITMFLALSGAFFTIVYAPVKQLIEGTPEKLWPGKIGVQTDGMPVNAMWIQYGIVVVIILLNYISNLVIGAEGAALFFQILADMTNVSMTLPYLFLGYAYYRFKKNEAINKPFEILKTKSIATIASIAVCVIVGFANIFTIVQPIAEQGATPAAIQSTVSMVMGPVVFGLLAILLMNRYNKKFK